jgi:hypothetical protein
MEKERQRELIEQQQLKNNAQNIEKIHSQTMFDSSREINHFDMIFD